MLAHCPPTHEAPGERSPVPGLRRLRSPPSRGPSSGQRRPRPQRGLPSRLPAPGEARAPRRGGPGPALTSARQSGARRLPSGRGGLIAAPRNEAGPEPCPLPRAEPQPQPASEMGGSPTLRRERAGGAERASFRPLRMCERAGLCVRLPHCMKRERGGNRKVGALVGGGHEAAVLCCALLG